MKSKPRPFVKSKTVSSLKLQHTRQRSYSDGNAKSPTKKKKMGLSKPLPKPPGEKSEKSPKKRKKSSGVSNTEEIVIKIPKKSKSIEEILREFKPKECEVENIIVMVRVRPLLPVETKKNASLCIREDLNNNNVTMLNNVTLGGVMKERHFGFDKVFGMKSTQDEIYEFTGKTLLYKSINGYNSTLFAYGQTGSGKTFTIEGTKGEPGVMHKISYDLFEYLSQIEEKKNVTISCSYLEIYNEKLRDLLRITGKKKKKINFPDLKIVQDKIRGVYVNGLSSQPVLCTEDILKIIQRGTKYRVKSKTQMNECSSRSHAILSIYIDQQDKDDENGYTRKESKINIIDLAGSEKASASSGATFKEGAKINLSLTQINIVINALVKKQKYIPYRNSKLTRILQDSLGGSSRCLVCCCISPADINASETLSSLQFATRAKSIQNKISVARDPKLKRIAQLIEENKRLKKRLKRYYERYGDIDDEGGEGDEAPDKRRKGRNTVKKTKCCNIL